MSNDAQGEVYGERRRDEVKSPRHKKPEFPPAPTPKPLSLLEPETFAGARLPNKITQTDIDGVIRNTRFIERWPGLDKNLDKSQKNTLGEASTLTICILTLANGMEVTGQSGCVDPANYDPTLGRALALAAAKRQIWVLEGYLLRQRRWELSAADARQ